MVRVRYKQATDTKIPSFSILYISAKQHLNHSFIPATFLLSLTPQTIPLSLFFIIWAVFLSRIQVYGEHNSLPNMASADLSLLGLWIAAVPTGSKALPRVQQALRPCQAYNVRTGTCQM